MMSGFTSSHPGLQFFLFLYYYQLESDEGATGSFGSGWMCDVIIRAISKDKVKYHKMSIYGSKINVTPRPLMSRR